jgi:hypothetical protein
MLPTNLLEQLSTALARWDGRGSSNDETLRTGKELAAAVMSVLIWDSNN